MTSSSSSFLPTPTPFPCCHFCLLQLSDLVSLLGRGLQRRSDMGVPCLFLAVFYGLCSQGRIARNIGVVGTKFIRSSRKGTGFACWLGACSSCVVSPSDVELPGKWKLVCGRDFCFTGAVAECGGCQEELGLARTPVHSCAELFHAVLWHLTQPPSGFGPHCLLLRFPL